MKRKTVALTKQDMIRIIVGAYVSGLYSGEVQRGEKLSKKRYKHTKSFIMNRYWYHR